MTTTECAYCRKLADLASLAADEVVWQFPHSVVLLGPWQYFHGYCVVVARYHATELSQLSAPLRHGFFDEVCLVAWAIEQCFRPHKLNYELLGNQVPHLHWHLFPRYRDDPDVMQPVWLALERAEQNEAERHRLQTGPQERTAISRQLRDQLIREMAWGIPVSRTLTSG